MPNGAEGLTCRAGGPCGALRCLRELIPSPGLRKPPEGPSCQWCQDLIFCASFQKCLAAKKLKQSMGNKSMSFPTGKSDRYVVEGSDASTGKMPREPLGTKSLPFFDLGKRRWAEGMPLHPRTHSPVLLTPSTYCQFPRATSEQIGLQLT